MKDKNTGITLVALVITIIILLILAGISIAAIKENGLFSNAKLAKSKYLNAQNQENEILKEYEEILKNEGSDDYEKIGIVCNGTIGEKFDAINWHECDGAILKIADYSILANNRKDLVKFNKINETPEFLSSNSRVKASGTADGNWPAYLAFSPTLVSTAGSGWISQGGSGSKWISVDMEKSTEINKIEITNINHQNREDCVGAPIDFSLKGSLDDVTYEDILNITENEHVGMGETYSYDFDSVSYRYYKIEITRGTIWWDGNLFYGFRFLKFFNEGDFINLPNEENKIIRVK